MWYAYIYERIWQCTSAHAAQGIKIEHLKFYPQSVKFIGVIPYL